MKYSKGDRVKDSRRAMNAHIVRECSLSGNPLTFCGKRMFYATSAKKTMNVCKRCKELS